MTESEAPIVSVCIPVYNGGQYIATAIRSVLEQSFRQLELVIVDNCSTDNTVETVRSFGDSRICLEQNPTNLGMLGNFNRAVSLCRGKLIKLLCADDLLYPCAIARQAAVLQDPANTSVVMVCSPRDIVDASGKPILRGRGLRNSGRLAAADAIRQIVHWGTNPFGEPGCVMFRAEIFRKTPGFVGRLPYLIDLLLYRELLRHGDAFVAPDAAAAFRVARGSTSLAMVRRQAAEMRTFLRELGREEPGLSRWMIECACLRATANALGRRALYALHAH